MDVLPLGKTEQGQPDLTADGHGRKAASIPDPPGRDRKVIGVGRVAGQPQRQVGQHRGGQVAARPAPVCVLPRPELLGDGAGPLGRAQAEELAGQQAFRLGGHVLR